MLIPAGSKLIGEYRSGILQGQSQNFVVWTRLIVGDLTVKLGSPGVDNLGVAGFGADKLISFYATFWYGSFIVHDRRWGV